MQKSLRIIPGSYTCAMLGGLLLAIVSCHSATAAPVPPTDNTAPPYAAVYGWNIDSSGITHAAVTANWLYRSNLWVETFAPTDSWGNLEYGGLSAAKAWLAAHPGGTILYTEGMFPSGCTLASGASGAYNSHWTTFAQNIVNKGLANNIIVRLGHEFTGNWYAWACGDQAGALNYAEYWRQIVTTMRAVPGAEGIRFDWCGTNAWTSYSVSDAYPGDTYVDYIGCDLYDQSWASNTYPYTVLTYPYDTTAPTAATRQANAWAANSGTQNNGLAVWKNLAVAHGKPLTIPEWGVDARTDNHGGLDNPYYVQQMYNFIQDPANNVYYHCYFDIHAGDGDHQLTQMPCSTASAFPYSAAKYRQLFGINPLPVNYDIGTVGVSGTSDVVSVSGAGAGFLTTGSDSFHFASRAMTGDDMFMAEITSMSSSGTAQSGVMMRKGSSPGDVYASLFVQNGNLIFQSRTSTGAAAFQSNVTPSVTTPIWLKLLRRGDLITGYQSTDGLNWTSAGSQTVSISGTGYAGIAVSSGNTTGLNVTTMDKVEMADLDTLNPAITNKIVMEDDSTSGITKAGTWSSGTNALASSGTCQTCWTSGVAASFKFSPTITTAGNYDVYLRWLSSWQRMTAGTVKVVSLSGTTTSTPVNQTTGDQLWNYAGTYNFAAGTSGSIEINNNSGAATGYLNVDAAMFVPVPPPLTNSLPAPKVDADIGAPIPAGSASYYNGVYTVQAGGTGFWSGTDQFNYVYQSLSGDQTLIARITGLVNTSSNATAGVMIRESTASTSKFVMMETGPTGVVTFIQRATDGTASTSQTRSTGVTPSASTPIWVKVVKTGQNFYGYYSTDTGTPTTWNAYGTVYINGFSSFWGGLAVHGHNTTTLTTATIDNVSP